MITAVGCTGDESAPTSSEQTRSADPVEEETACDATVKITGDKRVSWSGKAFAITADGSFAIYKTSKGNNAITVLPAEDDIPASVTLTSGKANWTTQPDSGTVEVEPDGAGATIDAPAEGAAPGDVVQIVANFACEG
ncbi:hypothetical protein [Nocardioides sp. Leaf307]|uniref:hypothetical protein n=1 Tax=Nocardioides sp. Leaf307 TaxID=1736331 RepID=UPI0007025A62|nr:hypothetical protein [Nocardioides sp. Leaf307]KQQ41792.1 hypothetical protein ASF50_12825 [Nocardioides sp. Leaf307]